MNERQEHLLDLVLEHLTGYADELKDQAMAGADQFWLKHHEVRKTRPKHEWGFVGVRVRQRAGAVMVEWFRAKYWQKRRSADGGESNMPALEYLARGKAMRYSVHPFERVKAKPWEIELAMELEKQFELIRRQSQMLGKIRRYIHETRRADSRAKEKIST
ncbi:hypothetical protein C84B14_15995 [Salinisphaera sp. C84B14]|uniref:conjugative transfer protein MobI(A/C) n=1 Tax=Salinisphaera sp. C84B14 TaxID=1304155 RepID=UPI00333F6C21